jgi:hypothetical protein
MASGTAQQTASSIRLGRRASPQSENSSLPMRGLSKGS